jgi:hypothetical protein
MVEDGNVLEEEKRRTLERMHWKTKLNPSSSPSYAVSTQ